MSLGTPQDPPEGGKLLVVHWPGLGTGHSHSIALELRIRWESIVRNMRPPRWAFFSEESVQEVQRGLSLLRL